MELQDQGFGEVDQSKGLTKEEIYQILLYLNSGDQTALQLTQKVFFWNAYLLGLRGGRRTAIQLLSDLNINEHTMMEFSVPSNEQRLKNTTTLINAIQEPQVLVSTQNELQIRAQVMIQEESQVSIQKEFYVSTQKEYQVLIQNESQVPFYDESQYESQVPIQRKPQILMQFKNTK
ncbi:13075_t:CDS:2, partial [Gigaspora rosea]